VKRSALLSSTLRRKHTLGRAVGCPSHASAALAAACACLSAVVLSAPAATVPGSIILDAHAGTGDGELAQRAAARARGKRTVRLDVGESRHIRFRIRGGRSRFAVHVRYTNDSLPEGPFEVVRVRVDGRLVGAFRSRDTGRQADRQAGKFGFGWNRFVWQSAGSVTLSPGSHALTVAVGPPTDGFKIEFDVVSVRRVQGR
jgi:hypothetical protein